jgi:sarcosine oxidase
VRRDFRVIVVGLGGIGSAATYWLARRLGSDVLGLEQFELGHDRGASHDHSRIIRLSYHRPAYVELAKRAYATWTELEAEAQERLVVQTGGLDIAPPDAAIPLDDYEASMTACGVQFDRLDAAAIMRRWPQWHLTDDCRGLFQERSGLVDAMRATATHQRLASAHGATLVERTKVRALRPVDGEVEVETNEATYRAASVVLATDAWTNDLLAPLGRKLPLTVTREQVTYVAARTPEAFVPERFPIWIWMDAPSFYGFPTYGQAGPKVAQDVGGAETTAATRSFEPDTGGRARAMAFLETYLPDMLGPEILTRTCLYTMPPDRDFVIDVVPEAPAVHVVLGAAHGFKYASLFGRILAERIVEGHSLSDAHLTGFRIDRPALTMPNAQKHFLV